MPVAEHPVAAYEPIAPGVLMAWPSGIGVEAVLRHLPSGHITLSPGIEIEIRGCEQAAWLTLEFVIPWAMVLDRGMVGVGMDVACSPVTRMGLQLRLPRPEGGVADFDGQILHLRPEMQRLHFLLTLPLGFAWEPQPDPPKIILWMSRESKRLAFDRLFVL